MLNDELRSTTEDIQVFLTSGYSADNTNEHFENWGFADLIQGLFENDTLLD